MLLLCGFDAASVLVLSALLHECGHLLAVYAVGGRAEQITFTAAGLHIIPDKKALCSYPREALCLVAGVFVNLIFGLGCVLCFPYSHYAQLLGGANLCVGLYNLMPVPSFDGGRLFRLLWEYADGPDAAQRAITVLSLISAPLVLVLTVIIYLHGGRNLFVAITGLSLTGFFLSEALPRPLFCPHRVRSTNPLE